MIVVVMVASHSTNATTILLLIKWVQVSPAAVERFFVSDLLSCAHKAISTQRMSSLTARETNQSGEPSYLQYRIGTSTRERDSWRRIAVSHGISRRAEDPHDKVVGWRWGCHHRRSFPGVATWATTVGRTTRCLPPISAATRADESDGAEQVRPPHPSSIAEAMARAYLQRMATEFTRQIAGQHHVTGSIAPPLEDEAFLGEGVRMEEL